MTFPIHITHRHVEGAGLDNEYYERVEPCDDYIDIEVNDDEVYADVLTMIYEDYFQEIVSDCCIVGYYSTA